MLACVLVFYDAYRFFFNVFLNVYFSAPCISLAFNALNYHTRTQITFFFLLISLQGFFATFVLCVSVAVFHFIRFHQSFWILALFEYISLIFIAIPKIVSNVNKKKCSQELMSFVYLIFIVICCCCCSAERYKLYLHKLSCEHNCELHFIGFGSNFEGVLTPNY